MSNPLLDHLLSRRSLVVRDLQEPGPSPEQINTLLACAHRVPDHGKIGPWRFVIFQGEARSRFGEVLGEVFAGDNPEASEKLLAFERGRLERAPLVIAVISAPVDHKVPEWEQILSAGAGCMNLLHGAQALGFGAQWLTEWYAYHNRVRQELSLSESERIAGFIYVGTKTCTPDDRVRPPLAERVYHYPPVKPASA